MKMKLTGVALLVGATALLTSAQTPQAKPVLELADAAYKSGKFAEAERLYSKAFANNSNNSQAATGLGRMALFSNRLADAEKWLKKAIALKPASEQVA